MKRDPRPIVTFALLILLPATLSAEVDFESDIAPLLASRCLECHHSAKPSGGLDLSTRAGLHRGGDTGRVVHPGDPAASEFIRRVREGEMPPESRGQSQQLPPTEVTLLTQWIAEGAKWPHDRQLDLYERTTHVRAGRDWWALQPVERPSPPLVQRNDWVRGPIDAFILAHLEAAGMSPAPEADRRTLIRRASFDLLGLPPTAKEVEQFAGDPDPHAYDRLIDRLLESPHYGERWARYWLDLVRFAETCGYERDQLKPNIWKYRDWVIDAFNNDVPYGRFVTEQLAGDEVPWRDEHSVVATGMLRAGTWNDEPNDPADYRYERLEDMVHTTCSAFIGLTVKCARCHDHKFDPIPQRDYYRVAGYFWPGYLGQANQGGPSAEQLGYDVFGWTDRSATAEPIRRLVNGERHRSAEVVDPGFLSAIDSLDGQVEPPPAGSQTTTRRLQFARWITNPENPLTARVFVNRLWLHHFGAGIVRTPNNFGFKGDLPTHPDLLDWLAVDFIEHGGMIKRMHRQIMLSSTYRQSSNHPRYDACAEKDFTNRLWWKFNRRRLDAEALRDAMLDVSGELNRERGGPSFYPEMSAEALDGLSRKESAWGNSTPQQRARRSVYMMTKRSRLLPFMTTFDFCDTTRPCGRRDVTTVAPQALALLNNHFVHARSAALARRVREDSDRDLNQLVDRAWQLALSRSPTAPESAAGIAHLEKQRAHYRTQLPSGDDALTAPPTDKLVLWLRADRGVETDQRGGVQFWRDASPVREANLLPRDASQATPSARPRLVRNAIGGQPALSFDGDGDFLHLAGEVLSSPHFSIFAVVADHGTSDGSREIVSNWHRRGRSVTSVFLGTRGSLGVRFTDAMPQGGKLDQPDTPFILTAVSGRDAATTFQNDRLLAASEALANRDLRAPYVIGTQGNYGSEWWQGRIAEIVVYDRTLGEKERNHVWRYLANRYGLDLSDRRRSPEQLALESLCHVLLNTNEFIYVD